MTGPLPYALAKELKDAGWAQPEPVEDLGPGDGQYLVAGGKLIPPHLAGPGLPIAYSPSLEELIEAVGPEFGYLTRERGDFWWARTLHMPLAAQMGLTPKEAVARLWLALRFSA